MSKRMSKLKALVFFLSTVGAVPLLTVSTARADGCYKCGGGSSDACKDYCRYSGPDTFAAHKSCEDKGCKISGTMACPAAGSAKVCQAPAPGRGGSGTTVATIAWCAAPPRS